MPELSLSRLHRRLTGASFAALIAAAVSPALAQTPMVTYPTSRALNDVAAWLQRDTPLSLAQVVDVSPSAVTAITSAIPTGEPKGFLASIHSEATDPQIVGSEGVASWSIPVEVDCDKRSVRLGAMTGYSSRDLATNPRQVREADTNWVTPVGTAPLGAAIRALCDHDFHRPFESRKVASAKPEPPPGPPPIVQRGLNPSSEEAPATKAAPRKGKGKPADAAPAAGLADATPGKAEAETPPKAPGRRAPSKPAVIIPPSDAAIATSLEARPAPADSPPPAAVASSATAAPEAASDEPAGKAPSPPKAKPAVKIQPPKGGGSFMVQIGASPNPADIQALLAKFKKQHGAEMGGLVASMATAQVDGKPVNRAILTGFASNAEANVFCKAMEAEKQACFVRR